MILWQSGWQGGAFKLKNIKLSRQKIISRLNKAIVSAGEDECWHYKGIKSDKYVSIWIDGTVYRVNRLSYTYYNGDIPNENDFICHTCDTPSCNNPKHLFDGSHNDNMQDMIKKKRGSWQKYPL